MEATTQKPRRRWPAFIAAGIAVIVGLALQTAVFAGAAQAIQTGIADLHAELTATQAEGATVPSPLGVTHPDLPTVLNLVDRTTGAVVGDVEWPAVDGCAEYLALPLLVDGGVGGEVAICSGP